MLSLYPADLITRVLILLIVFPAHELAHALAATRMGDPTPREHGRLTLNPFKHLDLVGSMLFVFVGVGWASTPINPENFGENRRAKMGFVALSGPLTNLALAVVGVIPFYIFHWIPTTVSANQYYPDPAYFFSIFIFLNLLLAVFNLIPISPLDGAQVLGALLGGVAAEGFDAFQKFGPFALVILVFILPMLGINVLVLMVSYLVVPAMQLLFIGIH
ncbi:MAG: site-2 protease family protein [Anaerolineales bacterium]|jgi:Zn-dependent protease